MKRKGGGVNFNLNKPKRLFWHHRCKGPSINYVVSAGGGGGGRPQDDLVNRPSLIGTTTRGGGGGGGDLWDK